MLIRYSKGKSGFCNYLKTGKKARRLETRNELDDRVPIIGNFNLFQNWEKWINTNKQYKNNYLHLSVGFSKEDAQYINTLDPKYQKEYLAKLTSDIVKENTLGYSPSEIISYCEMHNPKLLKVNDVERLPHLHIGILLYSPKTKKRIINTCWRKSNVKMLSIFQSKLAKKYNLTDPKTTIRAKPRKPKFETKNTAPLKTCREMLIDAQNYSKNLDDFLDFLNTNEEITYNLVSTNKNKYYKVKTFGKTVNLRGKDFGRIEQWMSGKDVEPKNLYLSPSDEDYYLTNKRNYLKQIYVRLKKQDKNTRKENKVKAPIEIKNQIFKFKDFNIKGINNNKVYLNYSSKQEYSIGICKYGNKSNSYNWQNMKYDDFSFLLNQCAKTSFSNVIEFKDGEARYENIQKFGNLIIYDIQDKLPLNDCKNKLDKHNFNYGIIPDILYKEEKNGKIINKYKVIIPFKENLDIEFKDKIKYKTLTDHLAQEIGIYDSIDKNNLCHEKSSMTKFAEHMEEVCDKNVLDLQPFIHYVLMSKTNNIIGILNNDIQKINDLKHLLYLDYCGINQSIAMDKLVSFYEPNNSLKIEKDYTLINTNNTTYNFVKKSNLLYDFKRAKTYNLINYIKEKYNLNDLFEILKRIENDFRITKENFLKLNTNKLKSVLIDTSSNAISLSQWQEKTKNILGLNDFKLTNSDIYLGDLFNKNITYKELDLEAEVSNIINKDKISNEIIQSQMPKIYLENSPRKENRKFQSSNKDKKENEKKKETIPKYCDLEM